MKKNAEKCKKDHVGTLPTIPNKKYSSKEFPMVKIHRGNEIKELRNFSVLAFKKIKKVSFIKDVEATALYGSQGQFGIYIIEVK